MRLTICFLLVCVTFYAGATSKCPENSAIDDILETPAAEGTPRYVLEMLLGRFDDMDRRFLDLQVEMSEHREELKRNRVTSEQNFSDLLRALHRLEQDVGRNMSVPQDRSLAIFDQQTACAIHDWLREGLFNHIPKLNYSSNKTLEQTLLSLKLRIPDCVTSTPALLHENNTASTSSTTVTIAKPTTIAPRTTTITNTTTATSSTTPPTTTTTTSPKPKFPSFNSCKDIPYKVSGVYFIRINNNSAPFKVFCEMEKFGGGWVVMQHRFNGSVDFNQSWAEYRDGFGELNSEFWLGLEQIYQLTTARGHEIVIEMKDFSGNYGYARYNAFQIGSESEQYTLKDLGSYSGTAGDSMTYYSKGAGFSTKDRDNSEVNNNLAAYHGGWWYSATSFTTLNGPYKNNDDWKSIVWRSFKNRVLSLSSSRMMIREL